MTSFPLGLATSFPVIAALPVGNTVYFAQKYKKEAKTLASKLGKGTIVKPIS